MATELGALGIKVTSEGVTKATNELDKFAASATKAGLAASKPIAVKISGSTAKVLSDIQAVEKALSAVRAAGGAGFNLSTSGTAKALADIKAMSAALVAAKAAAKDPIVVRITTVGATEAAKALNSVREAIAATPAAAKVAENSINRVTNAANVSAGAMRANTGNIAAQFQDIGVTAAMGMNPLLIALQQGTQLSAVFAQSGGKLGATLGAAFRSVLSPASLLTIGVVALSAYVIQLGIDFATSGQGAKSLSDELDKVKFSSNALSDVQGILGSALDIATGKVNTQSTALVALARAQLLVAKIQSQARAAEAKSAITASANDYSYDVSGGMGGGISVDRKRSPTWQIESQFRNGVIDADKAVQGLNRMREAGMITAETFGKLAASYANLGVELANDKIFKDAEDLLNGNKTPGNSYILKPGTPKAVPKGPKSDTEKLGGLSGQITREIAMLEAETKALDMAEDAALRFTNQKEVMNDALAKGIAVTPAVNAALTAMADKLSDAQIALRNGQMFKEIKQETIAFGRSLDQATERLGMQGKALDELTFYQELVNKATKNGTVTIDDETKARLATIASIKAQQQAQYDASEFIAKNNAAHKESMFALERERGELGLTGAALASYRLETQLLTEARAKGIDQNPEVIKNIKETAAEYGKARDAIDQAAASLNALNGALGSGPLGNLLSAFTSSNPIASLIGSGGIGSLVGMASVPGRQQYQEQAKIIADSISSVFGVSGPFATMLAGALQGSSLGSLGSSLVGGNSTGGAIGGALGGALMSGGLGKSITKGLTGALGEALGGALSSAIPVIGGIAGSLLGNLLKKDKWGSTIVSAGGSQGTFGNSGTSRAGSSSLAAAFNETLGKLATSLDATLGEFAVSIGVTNGKINVNPGAVSGMIGTTKQRDTIDFGEDQAAALKYAIQNAIEDGALVGLSEGWKKFLLASDNVEAQYQKLSNLQSAYDELDSIKNPQAFALASLDKAFNALRDTAYRAGDDMVRIEELYQLKRAEVIEDANSDALELLRTNRSVEIEIMQLEGKSVEALSAARLMEQEGLDASTIALMTRRNALQDEAAITEKAAEATRLLEEARKSELDSLLSLRERLFTARGDDTGLRNFQRALEYEKASAAEREALDQIYKAEDAARNAAAAAERRAAAEAKAADIAAAKSSLQIELLRALGDEEAAVALERKKALDATDTSLRSLQMQVWAAQDAAKALDEAKASFGQFATSLREFRDQLIAGDRATADAYRAAQVKFMTTAALAATGDVTALGKLQGVSESFLSASRDRATSQLQVDRDKAAVLQALNAGIDVSDDRVDAANAQLEAVREGNSAILALTAESKRGNDNAQVERVAIKSDLGVLRRLLTSLEQDGALRVTVAEID